MKYKVIAMKNGFTLVELSIVLVIIGLLIGGILVAQSLIESAGIQSFVRQVQQTEAAFMQFESKYRQLPGDSDLFDTAGNADGVIDVTNWDEYDSEQSNFFRHLSLDGFQPDDVAYSNDASSGVVAGTQSMIASFTGVSNNTSAVMTNITPWADDHYNYYFCDFSSTTDTGINVTETSPAYSPPQVLAIDSKMDDGVGRVADMTTYSGVISTYDSDGDGYDCLDGSLNYNTNLDTAECCIRVRVGKVIAEQ